ncbi:oligomerization domain protein [Toxoplasma gondii CAST]|uniref:Oligomerization domain protein n=1 Tax=Toxoplasma gondii CAST TaxID=943122 RepID=A0A3R7YWZ0_TOXGO|nr:oligomerization domain protein [Toxoplasma gondii CAST]
MLPSTGCSRLSISHCVLCHAHVRTFSVHTSAASTLNSAAEQPFYSHCGNPSPQVQLQFAFGVEKGVSASPSGAASVLPNSRSFRTVHPPRNPHSFYSGRASRSASSFAGERCFSFPPSWGLQPLPPDVLLSGVYTAARSHTLRAPWLAAGGRSAIRGNAGGRVNREELHAKETVPSNSTGDEGCEDADGRSEPFLFRDKTGNGRQKWTGEQGDSTDRDEGTPLWQGDSDSPLPTQSRFDRILQATPSRPTPPLSPSSLPSDSPPSSSSVSSSRSLHAAFASRPRNFPTSFSDPAVAHSVAPSCQSTLEEDDEALLQRLLLEHGIIDPRRDGLASSASSDTRKLSLSVTGEVSGRETSCGPFVERATPLMPLEAPESVAEAVGGHQRVPIDPRKSREQLDEEVEAAIAHFVPAKYKQPANVAPRTPSDTDEIARSPSVGATAATGGEKEQPALSALESSSTFDAHASGEATLGLREEIQGRDAADPENDGDDDFGGASENGQADSTQSMRGAADDSGGLVTFYGGGEEGDACPERAEYMEDEAFAQNVLGVVSRPRVSGHLAAAPRRRSETALDKSSGSERAREDERESESDEELTPAQRFYRDNRELLLKRAQAYYHEKQQKLARQSDGLSDAAGVVEDDETEAVDDEWAFFREPVVRPAKDHLWGVGWQQPAESSETGQRRAKTVELQSGRMPTVEEFVTILQQEHMEDIRVIDLEACGRRDVARFAIIGTGRTPAHCRRVGRLLSRLIVELQVPFLSRAAYCHSNRDDDWVIARCAHIHLHLMTRTVRSQYRLEDLWLLPHEHFGPETFPGYFDCSYSHPPPYLLAARDAAFSAASSRDLKAYESLMENQDYPDASVHFQIDAPAPPPPDDAKPKTSDETFSALDVERLVPHKE